VRLWSAVQALHEIIGFQMPPGEHLDYERAMTGARAQLGEEAFAPTWAAGQAMTMEQAIAYALEEYA
jgi:hypothetical protein